MAIVALGRLQERYLNDRWRNHVRICAPLFSFGESLKHPIASEVSIEPIAIPLNSSNNQSQVEDIRAVTENYESELCCAWVKRNIIITLFREGVVKSKIEFVKISSGCLLHCLKCLSVQLLLNRSSKNYKSSSKERWAFCQKFYVLRISHKNGINHKR